MGAEATTARKGKENAGVRGNAMSKGKEHVGVIGLAEHAAQQVAEVAGSRGV